MNQIESAYAFPIVVVDSPLPQAIHLESIRSDPIRCTSLLISSRPSAYSYFGRVQTGTNLRLPLRGGGPRVLRLPCVYCVLCSTEPRAESQRQIIPMHVTTTRQSRNARATFSTVSLPNPIPLSSPALPLVLRSGATSAASSGDRLDQPAYRSTPDMVHAKVNTRRIHSATRPQ
jgi:hypothetical protein